MRDAARARPRPGLSTGPGTGPSTGLGRRAARRRRGAALALLLALPGAAASLPSVPAEDELGASFAALADPSPAARDEALRALLAGGPEAGRRALEGFAELSLEERRARATVARRAGDAAVLPLALGGLDDPDARVRVELLELVGRGDLSARSEERVAALDRAARRDPDVRVRRTALRGLARLEDPAAGEALCRLAVELPEDEARAAGRLVAALPTTRDWLVRTVQDAFAPRPGRERERLAAPALAALLSGYGPALAETPGGGLRPADRSPFPLGAAHPDPLVRRAAVRGWNGFLARNRELGQEQRSRAALAALAGEGMDPREAHYRRAHAALTDGTDLDAARESARALVRGVALDAPPEERAFLFYGHYFEAHAALAAGRAAEGLAALERAGRVLDALRAERVELRPHLDEPSEVHAAAAVDQALFRALVEVSAAVAHLAEGAGPHEPSVRERARRAHVLALEAHLLAVESGAPVAAATWDAVLGDPLSPRTLLLGTGRGVWTAARRFDLSLALAESLAAVAPLELPGFLDEGRAAEAAGRPFDDPVRRELLTEILRAERRRLLQRRIELEEAGRGAGRVDSPLRPAIQALQLRIFQLGRRIQDIEEGDSDPLRVVRLPSNLALLLTREALGLGRTEEARVVARRALAGLDAAGVWEPYYWKQRLAARLEVAVGSSYMDEGDPRRAEEVYERALGRHEGLENAFRQRMQELAGDAEQRAAFEAEVGQSRRDQSNVLVSLAVNANVRWRDPEKALRYFERAYELQQSDFMQVLLACYRARSGRDAEARAELRQVNVSPDLYYNLACTYALLGDEDRALDFLAREFAENHPDEGSLARQRQWAAGDPDLASLRGDPRFERLVGGD